MNDQHAPLLGSVESEDALRKWWVAINGTPEGPHSTAYVTLLLSEGRISPATLVCETGTTQWTSLINSEVFARLANDQIANAVPPPLPESRTLVFKIGRAIGKFNNPHLPWFANWICIYCTIVAPSLLLCDMLCRMAGLNAASDLKQGSPLIVHAVIFDIISCFADTAIVATLVAGGISFCRLRQIGATLTKIGLALHLFWVVIFVLVWTVWQGLVTLGEQIHPADESLGGGLLALLLLPLFLLWIAGLIFEATALVWLLRNDDLFRTLEQNSMPGTVGGRE